MINIGCIASYNNTSIICNLCTLIGTDIENKEISTALGRVNNFDDEISFEMQQQSLSDGFYIEERKHSPSDDLYNAEFLQQQQQEQPHQQRQEMQQQQLEQGLQQELKLKQQHQQQQEEMQQQQLKQGLQQEQELEQDQQHQQQQEMQQQKIEQGLQQELEKELELDQLHQQQQEVQQKQLEQGLLQKQEQQQKRQEQQQQQELQQLISDNFQMNDIMLENDVSAVLHTSTEPVINNIENQQLRYNLL